jgi:L-lactate dehydrogenase complex protein LldG
MVTAADPVNSLIEKFIDRARFGGAEIERFSNIQDVIDFLNQFFREHKIGKALIAPDLKESGQFAEAFPHLESRLEPDGLWVEAGIVAADFGVAETGTLVHFDRGDEEKNVWTLPEICFCLLENGKIVQNLEAIALELSKHLARTDLPSPQVSLVTGPSRTADIENELTIGVHGPARLIILII